MNITQDTVKHIAELARISLDEKDLPRYTQELGAILEYIGKLESLDVSGVEPTSHAFPLKNVYRDDIVRPSLSQADALAIAVATENGSFKVPKVIE